MTTAFIVELGKYIQSNDNFIEILVDKHNLLKANYELKIEERNKKVVDTIINLQKIDNEIEVNYNIYLEMVKTAKININYI